MNLKNLFRALVAVAAFAAASVSQATPLTDPAAWTASGNADLTSVTGTPTGINLYYRKGDYFCAGCGDNYFMFETTVANTGAGSFDFSYNAFNGWFMAGSDLTILVNNVVVGAYGNGASGAFSFGFTAGDVLKLTAHETNFDSQPVIDGTISLNNFGGALDSAVPEPASIALLGLGLLGVAAARRMAARRK
jgi:hypothetical protein